MCERMQMLRIRSCNECSAPNALATNASAPNALATNARPLMLLQRMLGPQCSCNECLAPNALATNARPLML